MSRIGIVSLSFCLATCSLAQDSLNIARLWQSEPSGPVRRMIREGDVLYAAVDDYIVTYDISNFAAPRKIGSIYVEPVVYDFAVRDRRVYVIGYDSLTIFDATSPENIERLGAADAFGTTIAVNPAGTLVFIGDYQQFNVFDVSDPSDPWNTAAIFNTFGANIDIATHENAVYVLTGGSLQVWDATVSNNPVLVDSLLGTGMARQCAEVIDDTLYALQSGLLHIYELTFPLFPIEIGGGFADQATYSKRIAKADTMLIMAGVDDYFCFASIADLEHPVAYEPFQPGHWPRDVIAEGRLALFGLQMDDFYLVDFSDPESPTVEDTLSFSQGSMAHVVIEDIAITGQFRSAGLWTADISDPENVIELERQFHESWYAEYAVSDGILAAAPDSIGGFDVIDITDPAHPVFQSHVAYNSAPDWSDYHNDVAMHDHYVYAAFDSVVIYDVSNPQEPTRVFSGLESEVKDLAVKDGILWVLGLNDVRGYSLENPEQPSFIGGYAYAGTRPYKTVAVDGPYLYLATSDFVLCVDMSNPLTPFEISGFFIWGDLRDFDVQNNLVAIGGTDGIDLVSFADPLNPTVIGHHYDWSRQVTLDGDKMYSSAFNTFAVYDISAALPAEERNNNPIPTAVSLVAYPNPFNPNTTFGFELTARAFVTLDVFDVTGRQVRTLLSEPLNAGQHTRVFDAQGLPSGAYFARLRMPNTTSTARITLLR